MSCRPYAAPPAASARRRSTPLAMQEPAAGERVHDGFPLSARRIRGWPGRARAACAGRRAAAVSTAAVRSVHVSIDQQPGQGVQPVRPGRPRQLVDGGRAPARPALAGCEPGLGRRGGQPGRADRPAADARRPQRHLTERPQRGRQLLRCLSSSFAGSTPSCRIAPTSHSTGCLTSCAARWPANAGSRTRARSIAVTSRPARRVPSVAAGVGSSGAVADPQPAGQERQVRRVPDQQVGVPVDVERAGAAEQRHRRPVVPLRDQLGRAGGPVDRASR